jgi:enoyl-[acyl-carrier protein] reductase I
MPQGSSGAPSIRGEQDMDSPIQENIKQPSKLMAGKRGLIMGVANDHSIAWGIARTLAEHGATLALTYQGDALRKRLEPLANSIGSDLVLPCDVEHEAELDAVVDKLSDAWGNIDFAVHAIAYSNRDELKGRYLDTSRQNFSNTLDISCFSFTALAQRIAPLMIDGGSLLTLTYVGSERVMPNYNVMGVAKAALESSVRYLAADLGSRQIRVNAISAGPMRTLAGSAVGSARFVHKWHRTNSPLRRSATLEDVGGSALYLLSDLSRAVTGEILFVDNGYNIVGMAAETDSPPPRGK